MEPTTAFALASGVGNVLGGLFGMRGQEEANQMNLQIARENRAWQERMSNTAAQRAAKDFEAAGLNRILALGKPATTPAGNVATMQNPKAIMAHMVANTGNVIANTALQRAQAQEHQARAKLIGEQTTTEPTRREKITSETELNRATEQWRQQLTWNEQTRWKQINEAADMAGYDAEIRGLLLQLYRENPKLMLSQQVPWQGLASALQTAVGVVGLGAAGVAISRGRKLYQAYKAFKAKGGQLNYATFRQLMKQLEKF